MAKPLRRPTRIQGSRHVSPAEKAAFHQVSGAGRRHVLRQFFGLAPSDEAALFQQFGLHLDANLAREGSRS